MAENTSIKKNSHFTIHRVAQFPHYVAQLLTVDNVVILSTCEMEGWGCEINLFIFRKVPRIMGVDNDASKNWLKKLKGLKMGKEARKGRKLSGRFRHLCLPSPEQGESTSSCCKHSSISIGC